MSQWTAHRIKKGFLDKFLEYYKEDEATKRHICKMWAFGEIRKQPFFA